MRLVNGAGITGVVGFALASLLALPAVAAVSAKPADLILVNGHVLTVDPADSVAEAVAIRAGRIVAVGTNAKIRALAGAKTRVIDLKGRTATPGLIDAHAHIAEGGESAVYGVELSDVKSIAEVVERLKTRAAKLKPGEWIQGSGWDEAKLAERRYIHAADIDGVTPVNPVWLDHTTGHYGVANSFALKLAHVTAATQNPAAGTIDRDASGAPTGVLKESAQGLVADLIPPASPAEERAGILASLELMHREGMTAVKDPNISPSQWQAYLALAKDGKLTAHVCTLWRTGATLESARALIASLGTVPKPPAVVHENLIACGVKFFMDGSGAGRTAWVYKDWYKNGKDVDSGNTGYPLIDPAVYREQVRLFNSAGVHVSTHAVGDRAIDWVVDTYAEVLRANPNKALRDGIIHANIPSDHAIETMAALERDYDSGYPETQPPFTWWIGDNYAANLGPERMGRLNPYHSYLTHGVRWAGGSDYPVTPLAARYGLWSAVTRETLRGTYGAQPFGTAESVDIRTALKAYTIWAAHQLFLEKESGSLEVGKSADIAVWDRDFTSVPTAEVKNMKCELTLFRGAVVYYASGSPITGAAAKL